MKQRWIKALCLTTALTLSAAFGFAAEPVLPTVKDAAKAKATETKDAAKAKATDTKAAAKTEAAKATDAKDAAKAKAAETKAAAKTTAADTKAAAKAKATDTKTAVKDKAASLKQVDINTATEAELKAIPGIGDAYAAKIIAGRPYAKKDQLKSRKILPGPVYDQVQSGIIAKQPAKPAAKK